MLYTEGILTAEDRTLRKIARATVNAALRSVETKTAHLVDSTIKKLTAQTTRYCTVDQLLEHIFAHQQLAIETATIKRYADAFPELQDIVSHTRERIETRARIRLERAIAPFEFERRFRFAKVRPCF